DEVLDRDVELLQARGLDLTDVTQRDTAVLLDDRLAAGLDVERRGFAAQPLGDQLQLDTLRRQRELVLLEEDVEDLFVRVIERAQHDRDRELAPPVDTHEETILRVELEVEPGPAIGDDARREQE